MRRLVIFRNTKYVKNSLVDTKGFRGKKSTGNVLNAKRFPPFSLFRSTKVGSKRLEKKCPGSAVGHLRCYTDSNCVISAGHWLLQSEF
jgi:hypothetical protein